MVRKEKGINRMCVKDPPELSFPKQDGFLSIVRASYFDWKNGGTR